MLKNLSKELDKPKDAASPLGPVPSGTWHNITNIGTTPMQVYAIYAPAHHKPGKVQATAAAAEADKDDEPATWSVQPKRAPDKHG